MQSNVVNWFEIPVKDMERATKFYEAILGVKLDHHKMDELEMAWFPMMQDKPGATGSLVKHDEWYQPSMQGSLIYFSAPSGDLDNELKKVEEAGGKVFMPKKAIGEWGFIGIFGDSEGNRVAFHSMK